ncbi:MAG: glycosyl hydrolase family 8 [Cytophagaceae bacterium]|jgi:endo-1,4-beta-D-glucanase Y|nr:glycosyl hydrolase family 8 [Cytophagaceae bacterium]
MNRLLKFSVACVFFAFSLPAQVNTPSGAAWPFGSRIQETAAPYPYGLIPTNLPTGTYNPGSGLFGKSQDAYLAYNEWKSCYVVNCGGGQFRVRFDDARYTVSEGIAYGMLLAAYAADQSLLNGLYAYYKARTNSNGLMHWRIDNGSASGCGTTVTGSNGATDSELDVAMALIVAKCQWPAATSPYNYGTEASDLISKIRQHEIIGSSCPSLPNFLTSSGDGFKSGCNDCFNPSYQAPAYYRLFQQYDAGAPANYWTSSVPNASYALLNANRNTTTGLTSNWSDKAGVPNGCNPPAFIDHGYDAGRSSWRMATDYLWHGTAAAKNNFTQKVTDYIHSRTSNLTAANNLRGPVNLDGNYNGRTNPTPDAFFTAMFGAAPMGVDNTGNNQATLDFMYNRVKAVKQGNFGSDCSSGNSYYFGNTLRVLTLFMMTGNFWKPCPPRCAAPTFATDSVSTCGSSTVLLTSGLATGGNRTFQWFKDNNSLGAASGAANSLTVNASSPSPAGPGWFKVKVDTTGGCSQSDSIYVSSTAVQPQLGSNKTLCSTTSLTLQSGLYSATGYSFVWEHASDFTQAGLQTIPGENNTTLSMVRRPGLYRVTANKAGCTALWDTVRISSSLISPGDNCITASTGTVPLSVTGPNLGAASLYDWYATATGGSPMTGGTPSPAAGTYTWTTPTLSTGTYTFYVQDKSRQYGTLGKPAPTSPYPIDCNGASSPDLFSLNADGITAGWGVDAGNTYSQDWTIVRNFIHIDSVTVWMCIYNLSLPSVTFSLTNAAGGAVSGFPDVTRTGLRIVPAGTVIPAGPPFDGKFAGIRFYVGFNNVPSGNYRLKISSATPNLMLEQHPTNISYNYYDDIDGNTAYIKSSFAYSTTFANRYAHFYDWTISTENNCSRIPVQAVVGSCPAGLPAELLSFEGKRMHGGIKIQWQTLSEKNIRYYALQRMNTSGSFETISYVNSQGASESLQQYSYVDRIAGTEVQYYRLMAVEENGSFQYSELIRVEEESMRWVQVYPNPAEDAITLQSGQGKTIEEIGIYNSQGNLLLSHHSQKDQVMLSIAELPSGIYWVKAVCEGKQEFTRLIKR